MRPIPESCLIIGGGIAGLMAAKALQQSGFHSTVLDKGYGIGGRLVSRQVRAPQGKPGLFDYGCQHFQVGTSEFQDWVNGWIQQGLVQEWSKGFYDTDGNFRESEHTHYRGFVSNRSIAEHLAQDLAVYRQEKVIHLERWQSRWVVSTEKGHEFEGDWVLLTPPVPQTLALLRRSQITVPPALLTRLENITYTTCIAVLAMLEQESLLPAPGGLYLNGDPLNWIASNSQKGISPEGYAVTLHASHNFSVQHWETESSTVTNLVFKAAHQWLGSSVMAHHVHRWRYCQPDTFFGNAFTSLGVGGRIFAGRRCLFANCCGFLF
jgi:renalase